MKTYLLLFAALTIFFFNGCKNQNANVENKTVPQDIETTSNFDSIPYITLPFAELNKMLDSLNISDLESLAKAYYLPKMMGEGNESYTIYSESKKKPPRVTILHDNIPDDSQRGLKFTLLVNDMLRVIEIRKSVRCWPARGRGYWHGGKCS